MTHQQVLCNLIVNSFTHGRVLDSSDVFTAVVIAPMREVTGALAVLRKEGRLSYKKVGKGYVYWIELSNIEPAIVPVKVHCDPVIRHETSYSAYGHFKAFITKLSWWQFSIATTLVVLPWVLVANSLVE